MYKWNFDSRSNGWDQRESANIMAIMDDALRLFGKGFLNLIPKEHIIKNTQDTPMVEYKGDNPISMSELKEKYDGVVELLKSDSKYTSTLEELDGIIREMELFDDDNLRQMNADDVRELVGRIQNLSECSRFPEIADVLNKFIDDIGEVPFTEVILGEAYRDEKIIIYMQSINNCSSVNKHALVEQVLVHELFHAMHYHYSKPYIKGSWDPKSISHSAVKESLADFFAYLYILRAFYRSHDMNYFILSKELKNKWNTHRFPNYPYTGAKVFGYGKDESFYEAELIEKDCLFRLVQDKAMEQWETPYRVIMKTLAGGEKAGKEEYYRRHPIDYLVTEKQFEDEYERKEYAGLLKLLEKNYKIKINVERFPDYTIDDLRSIESSDVCSSPKYSNEEFEKSFYSGLIHEVNEYIDRLRREMY